MSISNQALNDSRMREGERIVRLSGSLSTIKTSPKRKSIQPAIGTSGVSGNGVAFLVVLLTILQDQVIIPFFILAVKVKPCVLAVEQLISCAK